MAHMMKNMWLHDRVESVLRISVRENDSSDSEPELLFRVEREQGERTI